MDEVRLRILRVNPEDPNPLPLPIYASAGASGMDLAAAIEDELTLAPFERVAVPTGFRLEIPEGFEGQVRSRSGLALREGLVCLNSPGTVDADYRGEVKVILANLSQKPVTIRRGERIAQLVICPVAHAEIAEADALSSTVRGDGGFGSTGR